MPETFRRVIKPNTPRMPITGHNKSGIGATGVAKTPAVTVKNPNQRKPFGT